MNWGIVVQIRLLIPPRAAHRPHLITGDVVLFAVWGVGRFIYQLTDDEVGLRCCGVV